jgi:hypothetical protein
VLYGRFGVEEKERCAGVGKGPCSCAGEVRAEKLGDREGEGENEGAVGLNCRGGGKLYLINIPLSL